METRLPRRAAAQKYSLYEAPRGTAGCLAWARIQKESVCSCCVSLTLPELTHCPHRTYKRIQKEACTFPTRVSCQNITVEVSTEYVEVTWTRQQLWFGVDDFEVNFTVEDSSACVITVPCTTVTCTFNSIRCGLVLPCTPTNITISGGSYTAPAVSSVTGPEKVTELALNLRDGVEYISWVNPSTDSSPCYENTIVRVYFDDEESISYFGHEDETMNKSLCVEGIGVVDVWTVGGDGRSNSSWEGIIYRGSDVVDLVKFEDCQPVDCTAIEVQWSYNPVCTEVDEIIVLIGPKYLHTTVGTTNLTVTGLTFDSSYYATIMALREDQKLLDATSSHYCSTRYEVPENLEVEALNSSSLRVTWDPPLCPTEHLVPYLLTVDREKINTTYATTYDVGGLQAYENYYVEVRVDKDAYSVYDKYTVGTYGKTAAPTPTLRIDSVQSDSVDVSWKPNFNYHYYSDVNYELTWGTDLQFQEETTEESFTITGFNSTDEVYEVCVATIIYDREDLVSQTDCKLISDVEVPPDGLGGGAIAGIVIGSLLVAALLAGGLFVAYKKNKNSKAQRPQTQQQLSGIQQQNYGVDNPAASQ